MAGLLLALWLIQVPSAQSPAAPSSQPSATKQSTVKPEDMSTIEGVVLKATGDPLKKAILTLRKADRGQRNSATSDASGHFVFNDVEPAIIWKPRATGM